MNFGQIVDNVTQSYCVTNNLPKRTTPHRLTPFVSNADDDDALEALTDEYRRDLLADMRHEELTKAIIHEHSLEETDLFERLITIAALWNDKPETAYERMKLIDQLLYDTAHNIAEKLARKDLDL